MLRDVKALLQRRPHLDVWAEGGVSSLWLCGLWFSGRGQIFCIGMLPQAFLTREGAELAARDFCPPAELGLNAATCGQLPDIGFDPDRLSPVVLNVATSEHPESDPGPGSSLVATLVDPESEDDT